MNEIGCTPEGIWLWLGPPVVPGDSDFIESIGDPDGTPNMVQYIEAADGRCAICHPFGDDDMAFFTEYCASGISSGDIQLLDALPEDWEYQTE
jgi:hypothetical protein